MSKFIFGLLAILIYIVVEGKNWIEKITLTKQFIDVFYFIFLSFLSPLFFLCNLQNIINIYYDCITRSDSILIMLWKEESGRVFLHTGVRWRWFKIVREMQELLRLLSGRGPG